MENTSLRITQNTPLKLGIPVVLINDTSSLNHLSGQVLLIEDIVDNGVVIRGSWVSRDGIRLANEVEAHSGIADPEVLADDLYHIEGPEDDDADISDTEESDEVDGLHEDDEELEVEELKDTDIPITESRINDWAKCGVSNSLENGIRVTIMEGREYAAIGINPIFSGLNVFKVSAVDAMQDMVMLEGIEQMLPAHLFRHAVGSEIVGPTQGTRIKDLNAEYDRIYTSMLKLRDSLRARLNLEPFEDPELPLHIKLSVALEFIDHLESAGQMTADYVVREIQYLKEIEDHGADFKALIHSSKVIALRDPVSHVAKRFELEGHSGNSFTTHLYHLQNIIAQLKMKLQQGVEELTVEDWINAEYNTLGGVQSFESIPESERFLRVFDLDILTPEVRESLKMNLETLTDFETIMTNALKRSPLSELTLDSKEFGDLIDDDIYQNLRCSRVFKRVVNDKPYFMEQSCVIFSHVEEPDDCYTNRLSSFIRTEPFLPAERTIVYVDMDGSVVCPDLDVDSLVVGKTLLIHSTGAVYGVVEVNKESGTIGLEARLSEIRTDITFDQAKEKSTIPRNKLVASLTDPEIEDLNFPIWYAYNTVE